MLHSQPVWTENSNDEITDPGRAGGEGERSVVPERERQSTCVGNSWVAMCGSVSKVGLTDDRYRPGDLNRRTSGIGRLRRAPAMAATRPGALATLLHATDGRLLVAVDPPRDSEEQQVACV